MVIIGGSSGMGLAIAKEAVDAGADVTIAGRSQAKLDEARQAIAGDVATHTVNVSDEESVKRLFSQIGSFDHRVVTGSSVRTGPLSELSLVIPRVACPIDVLRVVARLLPRPRYVEHITRVAVADRRVLLFKLFQSAPIWDKITAE